MVKGNDQGAVSEEVKEQGTKYILSKHEYDLYHEEDDIALPVIRVKHFNMPNKGSKWKIFSDNKVVFVIDGNKLTNKEKDFLKSAEGIIFILSQHKAGIKSLNGFKLDLKKKLTNK